MYCMYAMVCMLGMLILKALVGPIRAQGQGQCGRSPRQRSCVLVGLTQSGSYFQGVRSPNRQATPQKFPCSWCKLQTS